MSDEAVKKVVNKVLEGLMGMKPAWRQHMTDEDQVASMKKQLVLAFEENGICCLEFVRMGMKKARKDPNPFLPSVGQIVEWCTPTLEALGIPPLAMAYSEAWRNVDRVKRGREAREWSHPMVGVIVAQIGTEDLPYPLFKRIYHILCTRALKGEDLTQFVPKGIAFKKEKVVDLEANKRRIAEILKGLKS